MSRPPDTSAARGADGDEPASSPPSGADTAPVRDMQWKTQLPLWVVWVRFLAVLGGLGAVVMGGFLALQFMQTPAILLDNSGPDAGINPGALNALSAYAATHQASGTGPSGPRSGQWIEIPRVSIALPVKDGDGSNHIPDWVALHYPGTAAPGAAGNSYIYAHGLWGMFGALLFAKEGQEVDLHNYTTGDVQVFHITKVIGRVKWNDVSLIYQQSGSPLLTLQTCIGADFKTDRWVVEAA